VMVRGLSLTIHQGADPSNLGRVTIFAN